MSRFDAVRILSLVLFGALSACGGRTERKEGDDQEPREPAADAQGGTGGLGWGTTPLGDCKLGPPYESGKPCPWLADDHCYETREAACACDCPSDRQSLCVESFSLVGVGAVDCY